MPRLRKSRWLLVLLGGFCWNGRDDALANKESVPLDLKRFNIVTAGWLQVARPGIRMHNVAYQKWDEAVERIRQSRGQSKELVHAFQCHGSAAGQEQTALLYSPVVDFYSYYAFLYTSKQGPGEGELIWPGLDQPFINHARQMRRNAGDTPIYAHIFLPGHGEAFKDRRASLEEIQWQVFAAIGAQHRGLVWQSVGNSERARQYVEELEARLKEYAVDLGCTRMIDWATEASGQPISALRSDGKLFVVLLDASYMQLAPEEQTVMFPMERRAQERKVILDAPKGVQVSNARTLLGKALPIERENGRHVVEVRFTGGGEMIIFDLAE